jgi:hypothetical protein
MESQMDKLKKRFEECLKDPAFWTQYALVDITEGLCQVMQDKGWDYEALGKATHTNPRYIKRFMSCPDEMTVSDVAQVAFGLGLKMKVTFELIEAEDDSPTVGS